MERAKPPDDIAPLVFFERWVPDSVAKDHARRERLSGTHAVIVFQLHGEPGGEVGGDFTIRIADGEVTGEAGAADAPDLSVRVGVETWRKLNRGEISAPEALLRRRIKLEGDFLLGLKLHVILG